MHHLQTHPACFKPSWLAQGKQELFLFAGSMLECTIREALELVMGVEAAEKQSILVALDKEGHRAGHLASTSFTRLQIDEHKDEVGSSLRGIVSKAIELAFSGGVVFKPFPLIHPAF